MATLPIKSIVLADGRVLNAAGLAFVELSEKDNLQVSSPKNINFEPTKSVKFKPGEGAQIEFLADHTGDLTEVLLKALCAVDADGNDLEKEIPIRFKFNCGEAEYNTKGAANVDAFDFKVKTGRKEGKGEQYCQAKLKARSWDIRCMEHGGIALQPNGHDGNGHENKIKFESNRVSRLGSANPQYNGAGGDGMEFGTFNNEHASLFTGDYRFNMDAPVYVATRPSILVDNITGKVDYETQSDDFKDVITPTANATWKEIIMGIRYLMQTDGYQAWERTQTEVTLPDNHILDPMPSKPELDTETNQ